MSVRSHTHTHTWLLFYTHTHRWSDWKGREPSAHWEQMFLSFAAVNCGPVGLSEGNPDVRKRAFFMRYPPVWDSSRHLKKKKKGIWLLFFLFFFYPVGFFCFPCKVNEMSKGEFREMKFYLSCGALQRNCVVFDRFCLIYDIAPPKSLHKNNVLNVTSLV